MISISTFVSIRKLKKEVKLLRRVQFDFDPNHSLHISIYKELCNKGQISVLSTVYTELYELKKQLMTKGVISPELGYLLGEIYESYQEFDEKKKDKK